MEVLIEAVFLYETLKLSLIEIDAAHFHSQHSFDPNMDRLACPSQVWRNDLSVFADKLF
jgi:hypothetical protein